MAHRAIERMVLSTSLEPDVDDGARLPRWNITPEALYILEDIFRMQPFPPIMMREKLAKSLDVTPRQVAAAPDARARARCVAAVGRSRALGLTSSRLRPASRK